MRLACLILLAFCAACCAFIWADCLFQRRRDRMRAAKPIRLEAPLTAEQMDELDAFAQMEELDEDAELRAIGIAQLEWYANWKRAA